MTRPRPRLLFVCGRNKRRSPTAERLYRRDPRVAVRSAGVSAQSPHQISAADLAWADLILVMESEYGTLIRRRFRTLRLPPIVTLDIPDDYDLMAPELITALETGVEPPLRALADASDREA